MIHVITLRKLWFGAFALRKQKSSGTLFSATFQAVRALLGIEHHLIRQLHACKSHTVTALSWETTHTHTNEKSSFFFLSDLKCCMQSENASMGLHMSVSSTFALLLSWDMLICTNMVGVLMIDWASWSSCGDKRWANVVRGEVVQQWIELL